MSELIGKKLARLQDAFFKLHENGSNETSIYLSQQLSQDLNLSDGIQVEFLVDDSNLFKAICFAYAFPKKLYKKSEVAQRDSDWFEKQMDVIQKHFNGNSSANYIVDAVIQTGNRRYFKGLKQPSNLNIRDFLIEKHSILHFEKDVEGNRWLKVFNSLEELNEEHEVIFEENETEVFIPITPLQKIYFGSPGTGKSTELKRFVKDNNLELIRTTFHPDTDYHSFVGGYKPIMQDDKIIYRFVPQAFTKAYVKAHQNPEIGYVLAIEEINRGNCASIFGDLFQCLDRAKDGYSEYEIEAEADLAAYLISEGLPTEIKFPPNLLIYATMNTSDQSLFPMDAAFKRRWEWQYVPIKFDENSAKTSIVFDDVSYNWQNFVETINPKIEEITKSEDKKIGVYFITPTNGTEISTEQFKNKVMFYLWSEVCKDERDSPENFFQYLDNEGIPQVFSFNDLFEENSNETLKGFMKFLLPK